MSKKLVITIEGPEQVIDAAMPLFAKGTGYTEQVLNDEGELVDNPITLNKHCERAIAEYIRSICTQVGAEEYARIAREQHIEQSQAGLNLVTLKMEVV